MNKIYTAILCTSLLVFSGCSTLKEKWAEHRDEIIATALEKLRDDATKEEVLRALDSAIDALESEVASIDSSS